MAKKKSKGRKVPDISSRGTNYVYYHKVIEKLIIYRQKRVDYYASKVAKKGKRAERMMNSVYSKLSTEEISSCCASSVSTSLEELFVATP